MFAAKWTEDFLHLKFEEIANLEPY